MCEGGVDSVVLGAEVGDYGLVHTAADTPQPWYDESGGVYPSYHVVRALYAASGATRRATEISTPRDVQALAFETSDGIELWLANLLPEPRVVGVEGVDLSRGRVEMSCWEPRWIDWRGLLAICSMCSMPLARLARGLSPLLIRSRGG